MNDLYFYVKDGYNKIEIKGKSIIYMRTAERNLKMLEKILIDEQMVWKREDSYCWMKMHVEFLETDENKTYRVLATNKKMIKGGRIKCLI